jgi:hypothetical protein
MKPMTTAAAVAATLLTACAAPQLAKVPTELNPGANESLAMIVPARGVQIYECRARKDGGYEWAFVAPDAVLLDRFRKSIGLHGAGPSWQSLDGSRVVGTVKARADAPTTGAVPWLLLTTKSGGVGGAFSSVTSIQRVNTEGGIAPATGCSRETSGTTARVPYTADYYFFSN